MSPPSSRVSELLAANTEFAKTWPTPPTMVQMREGLGGPTLVFTCMDPRVVPEQFLGPNSRVAVYRNAGGRFSPDVVRTATVLRSLARNGEEPTILVVHHTDCGMTHLTDEGIRADVKKRSDGVDDQAEGLDFGCFRTEDLESTLIRDVEALKAEKLLAGVDVRGYVLETETGLLREVESN